MVYTPSSTLYALPGAKMGKWLFTRSSPNGSHRLLARTSPGDGAMCRAWTMAHLVTQRAATLCVRSKCWQLKWTGCPRSSQRRSRSRSTRGLGLFTRTRSSLVNQNHVQTQHAQFISFPVCHGKSIVRGARRSGEQTMSKKDLAKFKPEKLRPGRSWSTEVVGENGFHRCYYFYTRRCTGIDGL